MPLTDNERKQRKRRVRKLMLYSGIDKYTLALRSLEKIEAQLGRVATFDEIWILGGIYRANQSRTTNQEEGGPRDQQIHQD